MTVATHGWCHKDHGREIVDPCATCGRAAYVTRASDLRRCDGCGEITPGCWCPDARVAV